MTSRRKSRSRSVHGAASRTVANDSPDLHELLDEMHIMKIHDAFQRQPNKRFDFEDLRNLLVIVSQLQFDDHDYETLFNKINARRDGYVTWDEFVSYLILGFQQQEISTEFKTLENPIPSNPIMLKSHHRHSINTVTFAPTVKPDRTISWNDGSVMTCSKDGVINYWSLDMQLERSVVSSCPELKVSSTWVLSMCTLPDVYVVVTSSTERDLRFYDTSARKFELRVMMTSLEFAVTAMHYHFTQDINEESKLILGDQNGGIKIIYLSSIGRGPFKSTPTEPLLSVRFDQVMKGNVPGFRIVDFGKRHTDFVRQISYYSSLHSIVSCASCPKAALLLTDVTASKEYVYKVGKGALCFAFEKDYHIMGTGSADCLVRVWNPFVPNRPTATLYGHHAGVVHMVFQDSGKKLYTLSSDKCIKVWDVGGQVCMQTYLGLPSELGEYSDMTTLYNPEGRQWIIGCTMIAVVPLSPLQSAEHTDGNTHNSGVSVVLYNPLFRAVVTCGLDSYIIVWNPWDGRRMQTIKEAHTKSFHGEIIPLEITAACFDPGLQRLLTGAHDGSLKIWNFNTGTCMRNMRIEKGCEVKSVIWVDNRIMAIGWNRMVTEFSDSDIAVGPGGAFSKNWDLRHKEDISAAAVRVPQTLVTTTYNGELILWRLETGQPYKQFSVSDPTTRIKIEYKAVKTKEKKEEIRLEQAKQQAISQQQQRGRSGSVYKQTPKRGSLAVPGAQHTAKLRRVSVVAMPDQCVPMRKLAVHCMIFLRTREMHPKVGTLLVALENGNIQVWSHHVAGSFISSFCAIHKAGDYVISMCTDEEERFLFVGTTIGYVKTWLLSNYFTGSTEHVSMPKLRLIFPFLWRDTLIGRAKRMVRTQKLPVLLNSYKGHRMPVSSLAYINDARILISSSADCSARMWTLGGRYIQTLGTFKKWKYVATQLDPHFEFTIPPDIKRLASSTTMKVLNGGGIAHRLTKRQKAIIESKAMTKIDKNKIYGVALEEPLLGNYFKLPERSTHKHYIEFDTGFTHIPVYQHIIMPEQEELKVRITKPNHKD